MQVNNTTIYGVIPVANLATGGNIGAAGVTVDWGTAFHVTQTTANQTLLIPNPTVSVSGQTVYVCNTGTASFEISNIPIHPNKGMIFQWDAVDSVWIPILPTWTPGPALAAFTLTKTALTGTVTAFAYETQTSTDAAISTYAWSGAGVTFATASASTSTYTVASAGSYTITLTVTNASGTVETYSRTVKHDYILEVMGQDSEQAVFTTLQAAHDWINTNDAANSGLYRIHIMGATADAAAINITLTQLVIGFISGNSLVTQTINCNQAGPVYIFGTSPSESGGRANIATTGKNPCIVATGGNVLMKNVAILAPAQTVAAISRTGGTGNIQIDNCRISRGKIIGTTGNLQIIRSVANNANDFFLDYSGGTLEIYQSHFTGVLNWTGTSTVIVASKFTITLLAVPQASYAVKIISTASNVYIHGNVFEIASAGGAVTNHGICMKATGSTLYFTSNLINCATALSDAALNYDPTSTAAANFSQNTIRRQLAAEKVISGIDITTFVQNNWTNAPFHGNVYSGTIPAGTTYSASVASGTNIGI